MNRVRQLALVMPMLAPVVMATGCKEKLGEVCRCGDDCRSNTCAAGNRLMSGDACLNFQEVGVCVRGGEEQDGDSQGEPYCPVPMGPGPDLGSPTDDTEDDGGAFGTGTGGWDDPLPPDCQ